jgi:hypothetical protein
MFLTEDYKLDISDFKFLSEAEMEDIVNKPMSPEEYKEKIDVLDKTINKEGNSSELLLRERMANFIDKLIKNISSSNFFQYIKNSFLSIIEKFKEEVERLKKSNSEQISKGIGLFILTFYINTFIFRVLVLMYNPALAFFMLTIMVAPVVEESIRFIATKNDAGSQYNAILNIGELFIYSKAINANVSGSVLSKIWNVIKIRIGTILMHTTNTIIQKDANDSNNDRKIESSFKITILIHMCWNFFAPIILHMIRSK